MSLTRLCYNLTPLINLIVRIKVEPDPNRKTYFLARRMLLTGLVPLFFVFLPLFVEQNNGFYYDIFILVYNVL
jgi:hypothetical protein